MSTAAAEQPKAVDPSTAPTLVPEPVSNKPISEVADDDDAATLAEDLKAVNINGSSEHGNTDLDAKSKAADDVQIKVGTNGNSGKTLEAPEATKPSSVAASLREKPPGVVKTPFVDPLPTAKPLARAELDTIQETKYNTLLETCKGWKNIPAKDKSGPITEDEIMWLTRECILRYLRATKWSTKDAEKRLLGTLVWRREYGVEALTADYVSPEQETGKQLILGYDINARPCHYLNPGLQNTSTSPRQIQHLVYMLERNIELMTPGQETLALLINFKSGGNKKSVNPSVSQGREVLNILQTHYPERLGRALIINVPWVVWGFFKVITPLIDPLTKEKLKFNENLRNHVPPEQLWTEFQGDCEFEYDHSTYWPALVKLCEERRLEKKARWEKAGKNFGEHEAYLQGADVPSAFPGPA